MYFVVVSGGLLRSREVRKWLQVKSLLLLPNFCVKGQLVNILRFVGHLATDATTQFCLSVKAAKYNQMGVAVFR